MFKGNGGLKDRNTFCASALDLKSNWEHSFQDQPTFVLCFRHGGQCTDSYEIGYKVL